MLAAPGDQAPTPTGRGGLTTNKHDEDQLQIAFVHLLKIDFPDLMFTHIPNGGKRDKKQITRGKNKGKWYSPEGAKLKAMGLLPGIPDLLFFWPGSRWIKTGETFTRVDFMECGLIEVKTEATTSKLSEDQREVRARVIAMGGRFAVARTYESMRETLITWGVKCLNRVTFT